MGGGEIWGLGGDDELGEVVEGGPAGLVLSGFFTVWRVEKRESIMSRRFFRCFRTCSVRVTGFARMGRKPDQDRRSGQSFGANSVVAPSVVQSAENISRLKRSTRRVGFSAARLRSKLPTTARARPARRRHSTR